jgi:hypothetical protein
MKRQGWETGIAGTPGNSVVSVEGNNETIETNERRGHLPFFRELSSLSLFLELHF